MTPARFLRKRLFKISTQHAFAALLGYSQAHISRFENGHPFSAEAQNRIRRLAEERGLPWNNNWLFQAPEYDAVVATAAARG